MGPTDVTRPVHFATSLPHSPGAATGPACPTAPGEAEPVVASRNGGGLEGPFGGWESAWIDLGGEG
jgi:hypothetical protein